MKMTQEVTPELRVALELEAHEKECAVRYASVEDKLSGLDRRLWRLEAMIMGSTVVIVGLAASLLMKL
ncbi:hypothetical protein OAT17_00810 [Flavobacteriaceae bacterium]|nr:hypothetical protein [Flavobacteriaceae bacterium]